ncbi:MAG: phosphoribosylanthranilate isomerase [Rhizobiaceae bacterium]
MKPMLKICGLKTNEAVDAARLAGASHLGFIFFPKSPRHLEILQASELAKRAKNVQTVAVTVDAGDDYLDAIVNTMKPTMLQLHGSETIERVAELKARYALPLIKALAVKTADELTKAKTYEEFIEYLLLEAKPPKGSDLPGGNGVSFDWSLVKTFKSKSPVLLSGGVDLDNLSEAMMLVRNDANSIQGLDVSSGVESSAGVKDILKIEAFLANCQLAGNVS